MIGEIKGILMSQLQTINWSFTLTNVTEVFVIFVILFVIYKKFIKGTQSEKLVKGIFILLLTWLFSEFLIKINAFDMVVQRVSD